VATLPRSEQFSACSLLLVIFLALIRTLFTSDQSRYRQSAINEYACMKPARAMKLPVPAVWLLRVSEAAYIVERYDRVDAAGIVNGLHQFDGCQLLGHGSC